MFKKIIIRLGVVSILALYLLMPLSNVNPLPIEPSTITFVQGNYILANNEIPTETQTYADILGKDPTCPLSCQCVSLLKEYGFFTRGNAKDIQPNSSVPVVGSVVIFGATRTSIYGHVAIIIEIKNDKLLIFERNFEGCCVDSSRWISVHQSNILGYLTK